MKTLGAYMIVKNEEWCIKRCIDSIFDMCDEIIVVDTGSNDKTKELVSEYGGEKVKLYDFVWTGDFSDARNFALGKVTCDYSTITDADEVWEEALCNHIKELKERDFDGSDFLNVWIINYNENGEAMPNIGGRHITSKSLFPKWKYPVHEKLYKNDPKNPTTIEPEFGAIQHLKKENAEASYNGYLPIYYNQLNGKFDELTKDFYTHYFFYAFFTLRKFDYLLSKKFLTNIFRDDAIYGDEDFRIDTLQLGQISQQDASVMYLITRGFNNLSDKDINLLFKIIFSCSNFSSPECESYTYLALEFLIDNIDKLPDYQAEHVFQAQCCAEYNTGEMKKYLEMSDKFLSRFPNNEIAKNNNDFNSFLKERLSKICFVITYDKDDYKYMPVLLYYGSKYFNNVTFISDHGFSKKINIPMRSSHMSFNDFATMNDGDEYTTIVLNANNLISRQDFFNIVSDAIFERHNDNIIKTGKL